MIPVVETKMSGYDSLRSRTPKETLLEGFVKRMKKQNEEGRFRGSRIDHSNFVSNDSQEPSGEEIHGEIVEKMVTKIQLPPVNPLNKLYCSLMSGLRNEIDFGLRVSTILANSKESTWISDFKFIDILIDCVESYSCCCDDENSDLVEQIDNGRVFCNIRDKDEDLSYQQRCTCLQRFWSGLRQDIRVMNLVFGSCSSLEEDAIGDSSMKSVTDDEDDDFDEDLAHLVDVKKHEPKNHQRIYNLVKNIAEIIRNLSFNIAESPAPSVSDGSGASGYSYNFATINLLKFLVLLISCKDQYYQNLGLDILSSISSHIAINSINSQYLVFLDMINRYCVNAILTSNDINQTNRSLEIICKIVSRYNDEANEYIVAQLLDQDLLQRLTELLTCQHDVSIVISSLDLLLALSESCPKLIVDESKYLIKILVMLLNCEASQFFTKSALARIKVVDERPKLMEPSKINSNQKSCATTFVPPAADNESYVISWLRTCFEAKPNTGTLLRLNEIYEDYVKECIRCDRKNVITAHNFAILTKRCFPSITMTGPIIDGLIRRPVSAPTKGPSGLSSPILKAQLCAPPKAGSLSPGSGVPNPPSTSTLIKNLLANKLRTNSGLGTSSPSSPSLPSFSSITTGSVTVTPASVSSSSSSNKDGGIGSKSDTTTTIIPCTINNLNSTFTQPQKPQEPYPDPTDLQPSANKTAFSNSSPSHNKSKETNLLSSCIPTSVITSNASTSLTSSSSSSLSSSPSSSSNNIIVTSTTLSASTNNNNTSSLSTSVTITPAITNSAHLIPATSNGGSVNTQQVIVTANSMTPTSTTTILQPQTCLTTGQALQGSSVLITASPQPGQSLQPNQPQQFLLVRTIVGNQQQTGIVGMPTGVPTGTPVRLILPPGFLTQQRQVQQNNLTVNGVASVPVAITNPNQDNVSRTTVPALMTNSTKASVTSNSQTIITNEPVATLSMVATTPTTSTSTTSNSNDILLKAVLGSGIVTENPPSSTSQNSNPSNRSNTVKSSPLLNVLLDKGKLPDFSAMAGTINQSNVTNSCVTTITSVTTTSSAISFNSPSILNTVSQASTPITNMSGAQSNKVYILTTKSSLPIKSVPNIQQAQQSQTQQIGGGQISPSTAATNNNANNNLQKAITVQQLNQAQTVQQTISVPSNANTTTVVSNPSSSSSDPPTLNRLISTPPSTKTTTESACSPQTSPAPITVEPIRIDCSEEKSTLIVAKSELSNGEVSSNEVDKLSTTKTPNDITIVADVCKTVDNNASKLISKRSTDEDDSKSQANKKFKANNTVNSLSITPVKKEIKVESLSSVNKIKTNGTSVITSNAQQGKEIIISSSSHSNKPSSMTDSTTSSHGPVNGTSTNASNIAQSANVKSKPAIKPTSVNHKNLQFYCEWHECKKVFNRPSQVYWHVHKEHVNIYGNTSEKMSCKWGGPEGRGPGCLSSRPKLSLLTHINDFHCNAAALQQSALRRESGVNVPPPIVPPAHPGYASNAALLAIRRHAINYVEYPKPPPITPLSPITTSIRLTSALILRNLAQVSTKLRLFLQSLEPLLSELCIVEGREESRTIAQCLGVITERNERKKVG